MSPHDTSPEATRVQTEVLRKLGPARRVELAFHMGEMVRALARARIRAHHPEWDDTQVCNQLIWELYGVRLSAR